MALRNSRTNLHLNNRTCKGKAKATNVSWMHHIVCIYASKCIFTSLAHIIEMLDCTLQVAVRFNMPILMQYANNCILQDDLLPEMQEIQIGFNRFNVQLYFSTVPSHDPNWLISSSSFTAICRHSLQTCKTLSYKCKSRRCKRKLRRYIYCANTWGGRV